MRPYTTGVAPPPSPGGDLCSPTLNTPKARSAGKRALDTFVQLPAHLVVAPLRAMLRRDKQRLDSLENMDFG